MTSWSIHPVGGLAVTTLVALLLALALLVGPRKQLSRRQRITLLALRGLTALLLLVALLRPTLVTTVINKLPGTLLLLVDSSRSMTIEDSHNNESRWNALKESLAGAQKQFAELAGTWDLKPYRFDAEVEPLSVTDGAIALPAEAEGTQTAMGAAMADVLDREAQQRIVAVLVLSDGAQRAFAPRDEPPQTAVERLATDGIPLFTFTFGKPSLGLQSDLRVDDLLVSSVLFADAPATVQATVTADGYANQTVKVQLLWENAKGKLEVVDTQPLQLAGGKRQYPVSLVHTPLVPGEYKVEVRVESPEGELATSNNSQGTFVTVTKGGINILYLVGAQRVGGGPGIEPRFVRSALASYPDQHVQYELLNYRRQQLDLRQQISDGHYDVFLLGNVDYVGLSQETWEQIIDQVSQGAGLAMLGGYHSFGPGGFRNTPLDSVLPIVMGRAERQNFGDPPRRDMHLAGPLKLVPVAVGGQIHPIFQSPDPSAAQLDWGRLPPLDGANRLQRAGIKPNAAIVAEADNPERSPLVVTGAWGTGRAAAVAFDSTWHWQMEGQGELQHRFWRQLVLWLSRKDETQGQTVWLRLDQRRYQRGSRVEFAVGASDANQQPIEDAQFAVQVERPNGGQESVAVIRRGAEYVGSFENTGEAGDYRLSVTANRGQEQLGSAEARFLVPDRDMELDQPAAEPTFMASLAGLTAEAGGSDLAPEELPDLLERLEERAADFQEEVSTERTLWDTWPMLLALVALLSTEWWLRKRWGLV